LTGLGARQQGINLSELAVGSVYAASRVGIGRRSRTQQRPGLDAAEAEALYYLLEREVIPEFYTRNEQGIPTAWMARMRETGRNAFSKDE
jgi:glycogen phosphorylase